jgi:uncharacterized membrane protein
MKNFRKAAYAALNQHAGIIIIVFLGFMMRFYLAPWRSYWYDEFLSVYYYGALHDSAFAAVMELARNSIHPPLYQFILYNWMELFGVSELATRSLSNLYVAGGTLCLYLLAFRVYGRRVALGSALIFTLMYFPMHYGMETRSYAQTLFLACLSSWLLFEYVTKLPKPCHWRELLLNWRFVWLMLANTGLIMTHYYNVFFLGAQGLFLLIYFLARHPRLGIVMETAKAAAVSAAPVILLLVTWGWAMAARYSRFDSKGKFSTDFPSADPWTIFSDYVIEPTFRGAPFEKLAAPAIAVALAVLFLQVAWTFYRKRMAGVPDRTYFTLYILIWALVPCVMAFVLFLVASAERYSPRYFIFCAPPLAVIILLALEDLVRLANLAVARLKLLQPAKHYVRFALLYAMVAAFVIVAPGGFRAASLVKENYRGIAEMMVSAVRDDPKHSYILYEASRRRNLDFYIQPMTKGELSLANNIGPKEETLGEFDFEDHADEVRKHDFLIVGFTHRGVRKYPEVTKRLAELYDTQLKLLDRNGRGIIVYKTK